MGILNFLPKFKQLEPDNLYGLTMGYVLAQRPVKYTAAQGSTAESYGVATVTVGDAKFIENGILCALDGDGNVVDAAGTEKQLFIHFTEELNTIIEGRKYFAVEADGAETFLRLVALVPGSEWTTNVVYDDKVLEDAGIIVTNENATLPTGEAAKSYLYVG